MVRRGLYSHRKFDHEYAATGPPQVSFMVCALPRSGSSVLCELLTRTQRAGAPTEFFEPNQRQALMQRWEADDLSGYIREMLARKTTPNGVFGVKALYHQLVDAIGDTPPEDVFPNLRYVYVKREDHVRQAVSFARAIQSDQWASDQPAGPEPVFDAAQIAELIEWIEREESAWEALFLRAGVEPLRIVYEAFVEAMDSTLAAVLRFLHVDLPPGFELPRPTLERQSDEASEEWVRRYVSLGTSSGAGA